MKDDWQRVARRDRWISRESAHLELGGGFVRRFQRFTNDHPWTYAKSRRVADGATRRDQ